MRRVRGRGRGLEVHVRWEGEDAAGTAERWADSWVGVTWLTHDLRREAREMEVELYRSETSAVQPTGPAASRPRRASATYGAEG